MSQAIPELPFEKMEVADQRLSVPGPGRALSAVTEERAAYVRKAIRLIEPCLRWSGLEAAFKATFGSRWDSGHTIAVEEAISARAAWAMVNTWLLARMTGAVGTGLSFLDAEKWFFGRYDSDFPSIAARILPETAKAALNSLSRLTFDKDLLELLPYILELHGPGSRLSVIRDPTTRAARDAKKRSGIFYTPADVAEYMASGVLSGHVESEDLKCLDPSCGTGVFLVALLRAIEQRHQNARPFDRLGFATRSLYGLDISPLAVESCTFVLLHHCMGDVKARGIAPWLAWQALRLNLVSTDALQIQAVNPKERGSYERVAQARKEIRSRLLGGQSAPAILQARLLGTPQDSVPEWFITDPNFSMLGEVFPEAEHGFEILIGNPPYAPLGHRRDLLVLAREYSCFRSGQIAGTDLYPFFIEMMWRFTRPGRNSSAIVAPLSIAYHQGSQFKACRKAMISQGGRWRCAFFDREPHALFGEEVKTRNAILFRTEMPGVPSRGSPAKIETGPLQKWTSRTREKLFSSISFTPLERTTIAEGIPKLSGWEQARAYCRLAMRSNILRTLCERAGTCQAKDATVKGDYPRVFVASTAYNFLNVFRSITYDPKDPYPLTENTIHRLDFGREETAEMVFAILSSKLTYWLWHVQGDGFHVGASFIQNLPFGRSSFTHQQAEALQKAGRELWEALQSHRIASLNKGRETVAYRPLACEKERDIIDEILIEAASLPKNFNQILTDFVKNTVIVDKTDSRRKYLESFFKRPEASL